MAYSLIAQTGGGLGSTSPRTTSAIDTSGANILFVIATSIVSGSVLVITDSKSNTWTALTEYSTSGNSRTRIYYAINPNVGSGHTVTLTSAADIFACAWFVAFSGSAATPFDSENGSTGSGQIFTNPVTPSENDELIITGFGTLSGTTPTVSDGVTLFTGATGLNGGNWYGGAAGYKIQTTAASINPQWSPSDDNSRVIACFKMGTGPTPVTKTAADAIAFSDSLLVTSTGAIAMVDTISLSDVLATFAPSSLVISDTISLSDYIITDGPSPPAPPAPPAAIFGRRIWTDEQLAKWSADALIAIANDVRCIWARETLAVSEGQSVITLPSYVRTLQRVTWRGQTIQPVSWIDYQLLSFSPSPVGIPTYYAMHPTDVRNFILYPSPNETFVGGGNPYVPQPNSLELAVEYWRIPDSSASNSPISLPTYVARRTQKAYVLWHAFAAEGKGQDLGAAQYYKGRYQFLIEKFRRINEGAFISKRYALGDGEWPALTRPAKPQLGINFERTIF